MCVSVVVGCNELCVIVYLVCTVHVPYTCKGKLLSANERGGGCVHGCGVLQCLAACGVLQC